MNARRKGPRVRLGALIPEEKGSRSCDSPARAVGQPTRKEARGMAVVLAVALSIGLFVLLPNTVIMLFPQNATGGTLLIKNLVSGVIRIAILIAYISFVGRIPEMRKTFQYHGSEHKTVYCHEHDLPLTPKNAQQFTTLHPRCGTSFLLLTFFLSIIFYSIIDVLVLQLTGFDLGAHYVLRVLSRIVLLPCVAGISYEALKALAHAETPLTRALRWPGLQMQRLTTNPPDASMIECAIAAMELVLAREKREEEAAQVDEAAQGDLVAQPA